MKRIFFGALALSLIGSLALAVTPGSGARPLAMGNSFLGMADDASALFLNPAGISDSQCRQFTSLYSQLDTDLNYGSLGVVVPDIAGMTLGAGLQLRTASNLTVSSEVADYTEMTVVLPLARKIRDNLSVGGSLRFYNNALSKNIPGYNTANGSGYGAELALKYRHNPELGLGATVRNLGGQINHQGGQVETIPVEMAAGLSYLARPNLALNADLSKKNDEPLLFHAGTEWWPVELLALRAGLDQSSKNAAEAYNNLTAGLGFKARGLTFDYAMYQQGDPSGDITHYFSLGFTGSETAKQPVAVPPPAPVSPPTGEAETARKVKRAHFNDVPRDFWGRDPIELLATAGLVNGYPDGSFRPQEKLTRMQFSLMLLSAKNLRSSNPPKEVNGDKWGKAPDQPVTRWEAFKLIGVTEKVTRPKDPVTRAEFAFLLAKSDLGKAAIKRLPTLEE